MTAGLGRPHLVRLTGPAFGAQHVARLGRSKRGPLHPNTGPQLLPVASRRRWDLELRADSSEVVRRDAVALGHSGHRLRPNLLVKFLPRYGHRRRG